MKEIFEQWGPLIIAAAAIALLVAIISSDEVRSFVTTQFTQLITTTLNSNGGGGGVTLARTNRVSRGACNGYGSYLITLIWCYHKIKTASSGNALAGLVKRAVSTRHCNSIRCCRS